MRSQDAERREPAVVLLSGGLDSGVALAEWCAGGGGVALCVCADYGQRAATREADASRRLAARFDLPWRLVELPWLGDAARIAGAALMPGAAEPPERSAAAPGDAGSAAAVWVPARNLVLVAIAAAFVDAFGGGVVVAGFNREEAATFPDNSREFAAACDRVLALGTRNAARVVSPTIELDKRAIAGLARRHGLGPADFWSCYRADSDPATCRCESCVRSRAAWAG